MFETAAIALIYLDPQRSAKFESMLGVTLTGICLFYWLRTGRVSRFASSDSGSSLPGTQSSLRDELGTILLLLALCIVANPEARMALLAIEAIGFDLFVLLVCLQLQTTVAWAQKTALTRVWHLIRDWPPLPFIGLNRVTLRLHPTWSLYSGVAPVFVMGLLSGICWLLVLQWCRVLVLLRM